MNKFNKMLALSLIVLGLFFVSGCSSNTDNDSNVVKNTQMNTTIVSDKPSNTQDTTTNSTTQIENTIANEVIGTSEKDVQVGDLI